MAAHEAYSLAGFNMFAELDDPDRLSIEQNFHWHRFAAGEQITNPEMESRKVFFVARGIVRAINYSFSGREVTLDEFPAGACFGEIAVLTGVGRPGIMVALTACVVASVSSQQFVDIARRFPSVAFGAMKELARRVRSADERITDLATLTAIDRVYAELLRLARTSPEHDNAAIIQPVPTYSDIASRIGTARETVGRVMGELIRHRLVVRTDGAMVITDVERLKQVFEEEPCVERRSGRDRRLGLDRRSGLDRRHHAAATPPLERRVGNDRRQRLI